MIKIQVITKVKFSAHFLTCVYGNEMYPSHHTEFYVYAFRLELERNLFIQVEGLLNQIKLNMCMC